MIDPDQLLDRYHTLTGWSEALRRAGAAPVTVVQRFHRDARIVRNGIEYVFRRAGIPAAVAACAPDVAHVNGLTFPGTPGCFVSGSIRRARSWFRTIRMAGPIGRAPDFGCSAGRHGVRLMVFCSPPTSTPPGGAARAPSRPISRPCVMEASTSIRPTGRERRAEQRSGLRGSPAILWVGRLNANKDPLTLLEGFERALGTICRAATLTMIYSERRICLTP